MTYEEKKAWLWRYRTAKRFELLKLDELATLQTDATHTTQRFSPVPGGSGDGQALPRSVERIDEARRPLRRSLPCATPSGPRSWRCSASWTMRWIS